MTRRDFSKETHLGRVRFRVRLPASACEYVYICERVRVRFYEFARVCVCMPKYLRVGVSTMRRAA